MSTTSRGYIVVDPIGHRRAWRVRAEADQAKYDGVDGFSYIVPPVPDDVWVCDLCNGTIDHTRGVPCVGSYGVCADCVAKFEADGIYWPDDFQDVCGCDPCVEAFWQVLANLVSHGRGVATAS